MRLRFLVQHEVPDRQQPLPHVTGAALEVQRRKRQHPPRAVLDRQLTGEPERVLVKVGETDCADPT
ncbi:MAG: hypothetical protein ACREMW_05500, partial [Gemmatimonadales bacterium]